MTSGALLHLLRLASNFVLFEVAWFAAISGGANGLGWAGPVAAGVVIAVHLAMMRAVAAREIAIIGGITALGLAVEALFMQSGALTYAGTAAGQVLPPIWIVALWAGFGTLPSASLAWLDGRWTLQAILGAVFGPLTYYAGAQMGAASLGTPLAYTIVILAVGWALAMPACFAVARAIGRLLPAAARR